MNWYYLQQSQAVGPVEEETFELLVREQTISPETLVWQEGMAGWQPYAKVAARAGALVTTAAAPPVPFGVPLVACSRCGRPFPTDLLFQVDGHSACANCMDRMRPSIRIPVSLQQTNTEKLRCACLRHERAVHWVGVLYVLGGALALLGIFGVFIESPGPLSRGAWSAVAVLGALHIWTGLGLNRLRPWSRIAAAVIPGVWLGCVFLLFILRLLFPRYWPPDKNAALTLFMSLVNGCILFVLVSAKASLVFSEPYRQAIAATPHVKHRTSMPVLILYAVVFLFFVLGFLVTSSRPGK